VDRERCVTDDNDDDVSFMSRQSDRGDNNANEDSRNAIAVTTPQRDRLVVEL